MTLVLPWKRAVLPLVTTGALTAVGVQFTATLGVLEHEFTIVFSAISVLLFYGMTGTVYRRVALAMPQAEKSVVLQASLFLLLIGGLAMAATALAIMYVFNVFRYDCYFGKGMPFFWLTWVPIVLFMAVVGLWTAARGWGWIRRTLFFVLMAILLGLHDWILLERGLRAVDPLFGVPLGFDQRASIVTPHLHIYQRIGLMLFIGALWASLLWRSRPEPLESAPAASNATLGRWVGFLWALSLLYLFAAGSYAGLGFGAGKFNGTLSETRESEHFHFRFAPYGKAEANIAQTIRFAEWNWSRLTDLMAIEPAQKVNVYITENHEMLWELSGIRAANAGPWRMIIDDYGARSGTFFHELVHALDLGDARTAPETTSPWQARLKLLKLGTTLIAYRGQTEGIAQAYSGEFATTKFAHQRQAAALVEGQLPSAAIFMGRDGFRTLNESNAYNLAGSFMGYLVLTYGNGAMNTFLDDRLDYERAFGKNIEALDAEWRVFLQDVPVTTQDVLSMGRSFDPSISQSYVETCCPKLGARTPDPKEQSQELYRQGRFEEALSALEALYATSEDPRYLVHQITVYRSMGNLEKALELLERCLANEELATARKLEYSRLKEECLTELRAWEPLYALHAEWGTIEPDASAETKRTHRLLAQEAYRDRMATLLTSNDDFERRSAIASLATEFPLDEDIAYLYLAKVYGNLRPNWNRVDIVPENRNKLAYLQRYLLTNPAATDLVAPAVERFVDRAIFASDFALAEALVTTLAPHTEDPMRAHRCAVLSERIAFEKAYAAKTVGAKLAQSNHFSLRRQTRTSKSIKGTSISTPTTVANAAPEESPKSMTAVAIATSK